LKIIWATNIVSRNNPSNILTIPRIVSSTISISISINPFFRDSKNPRRDYVFSPDGVYTQHAYSIVSPKIFFDGALTGVT